MIKKRNLSGNCSYVKKRMIDHFERYKKKEKSKKRKKKRKHSRITTDLK